MSDPRPENSGHFATVLRESLGNTWDAVFANRPRTVLLTVSAACLAIYLARILGRQTETQMKDAFISVGIGLAAYLVMFVAVFFWNALYATPKHLYLDSQTALRTAETKLGGVAKLRLLESDLSRLWKQGNAILEECHNYDEPPPEERANQWDIEAIQFLETRLGEPKKDFYLSGQRHIFAFMGKEQPPAEHRELMGIVSLRVANLRKIVDDLPPIPPL